jgi:16S rRNA processing protein RimM
LKSVEIGRITRPHGIRGEVRVELHWEGSDTLAVVREVTLARRGTIIGPRRIFQARRGAGKVWLVKFEGVDDRDAAEVLRGATVSVPREALPELEPGEYYLSDLVGARVVGPDGPVGTVVEIRVHPSVDTLVVSTADGRTLEQPLAEPWVSNVDADAGLVELSTTDGLI